MIERLRQLIGDDAVSDGDFLPFRVHGRKPAVVVSPWNADQAAAVLRTCSENGWIVEPAGAGTWLGWGRPPERVDIVLSAERLAGVSDYEPADLTVTVAAGTPLAEVSETVSADRQTLGLDPPARPGATIGAVVSQASAGPLRLSLGSARDQVLGLEMVTGDGRIVQLGGRVVKNVAGYDLVRLAVGSRGTLGFITRAHLRLRPAPDTAVTALFYANSADPLVELAGGPVARTWPAVVEILAPGTAAASGQRASWTLAVRCSGNTGFVSEATRRLRAIVPGVEPDILDESVATHFWDSLATLEARSAVEIRLASLPGRLRRLIALGVDAAALAQVADGGKIQSDNDIGDWHLAAHAGNGIVRLWRTEQAGRAAGETLVGAIIEARSELAAEGGTVTMPLLVSGTPPDFDPFGHPGPTIDIMRGIKAVFDPAGILAPGRFTV